MGNTAPYTITFTAPGSFAYHCSIHPDMTATVTVAAQATTFYFAEGYTGPGFTETLDLFMPNHSGTATIDYYLQGGVHQPRPPVTLSAGKVTAVDVNNDVGASAQVSARVTLPFPGVAERTMHFGAASWYGSTDKVGVTAPSTEWDFAEGSTLTNAAGTQLIFSEFLTLQNPNASAVPVSLNYFTDSGQTPVKTLSLPANSRTTVEVFHGDTSNVTDCAPDGNAPNCGVGPGIGGVSVQVKSGTLPIIAERPFYVDGYDFGDLGYAIQDGHDAFGATAPGTTWDFAEGTTQAAFKEYLTLQNPGGTTASVNLNYFTNTGAHPTKTVMVNAHSRLTVEVFKGDTTSNQTSCIANGTGANCGVGPGVQGVSVQVTADQPIVAERPMYMALDFGSGIVVRGAHDVMGATGLGQLFGFAAGSTAPGDYDFLTLQNPMSTAANVTITYDPFSANLGPIMKAFSLPADTRSTVEVFRGDTSNNPGCSPTAGTCGVGMGTTTNPLGIVVSSDRPILVEKPTYSSNFSTFGATDTLGYSPISF